MAMISVIVPVYKVERYICRCVDSILDQTFSDFELILVDDGSPDHCGEICDAYAAKDSRIHVIHQENGGLSAARNAGIDWMLSNSDSRWVTFIDSDDWIHPDMLSALYDAAVKENVKVSICGHINTEGETPEVQPKPYKVTVYSPEDFLTSIACAKLYDRDCFETIRYPVGKVHEDEFTTYRILFQQDRLAVIDAHLYFYFQNANSIMGSPWSPKRLVSVEARKEQTDYFKKHGFKRAYSVTAIDYAGTIMNQRAYVRDSNLTEEQKRKYEQYLLSCLRKASWDYMDVYFWKELWIYAEAYPALTAVYKKIKGLIIRH